MRYRYNTEINHPLIDSFFEIKGEGEELNTKDLIIPDCTPGLMYVEEGELNRVNDQSKHTLKPGTVFLFGQKTKAVEYNFGGASIRAFGAKLKPQSIFAAFGVAAAELCDEVVDLSDLLPKRKEPVIDKQPTSKQTKQHWLSNLMPVQMEARDSDILLHHLLKEIHLGNGELPIQTIIDKYGIGYKRMQRLFKLYIGINPKMYSRIIRFNHCLKYALDKPDRRLTDMAYQSNYFDQNHFVKEFKLFTGKIPSQMFGQNKLSIEWQHLTYLMDRGY